MGCVRVGEVVLFAHTNTAGGGFGCISMQKRNAHRGILAKMSLEK